VICKLQKYGTDGVQRSELSGYWKNITDDALNCSSAFIQAQKQ